MLPTFLDLTEGSVADISSRIFTTMRGFHIILIDGVKRRGNNVQARRLGAKLRGQIGRAHV